MKTVKYILVNETSSEKAARAIRDSHLSDIRLNHIVSGNLRNPEARAELIGQLCRLRRRYPNAKILGVGELGEHCVHSSEAMNKLRREMSDLP
jgi:hypothetical protein